MANNSKTLPVVGDVIRSPKFAFAYLDGKERLITVDGRTVSQPVESYISTDERLRMAAETGNPNQPETRTEDLGAHDPSRAYAEYVVVEAKSQGGGKAQGFKDIFPDGWHIKARRLTSNGEYDPEGELIQFYMTGCFSCKVPIEDIDIIRKMEVVFT